MRFIIILILLLSSMVLKSSPCDTTKLSLTIPKLEESNSYIQKIAYVYEQEYGGYQITFILPDVYYWMRNPDMIIKLVDLETGMTLSTDILYDVEKGKSAFVKPGRYMMMIYVISHTHISFFGDMIHIIELTRTDKTSKPH